MAEIQNEKFSAYHQAIDYMDHSVGRGWKDGLRGIDFLMEKLGRPEKKLRYVHVTGTNGKGSTSVLTASALQQAGYKVGLYISPHVDEFRERIQINRTYIPEEAFTRIYGQVAQACEELEEQGRPFPTEFEQITATALAYFAQEQCDIVVLEVGIGGIHDVTNIVPPPEVAVFTPISLDHMNVLGDTVEEIAVEKSGIIKPGCTVVICPRQDQRAVSVLRQRAAQLGAAKVVEVLWPEEYTDLANGVRFTANGLVYAVPFSGVHQVQNGATALAVLHALQEKKWSISEEQIQKGFARAVFQGRLEIIGGNPLVVLDGSHNPAGVEAMVAYAKAHLKEKPLTIVLGMLKDKSHKECIPQIAALADHLVAVGIDYVRGMTGQEVAQEAAPYCSHITVCPTIGDGMRLALQEAEGAVLACGSLYLPGEARIAFEEYTSKKCTGPQNSK